MNFVKLMGGFNIQPDKNTHTTINSIPIYHRLITTMMKEKFSFMVATNTFFKYLGMMMRRGRPPQITFI